MPSAAMAGGATDTLEEAVAIMGQEMLGQDFEETTAWTRESRPSRGSLVFVR
ncbi:hypothetical protein [Halomonas sp. 25-S5]|uniref:hypothetical protein n=1 Tax=Halomonas sp. 25-S5 TaxID=2994065 RepID=UPI002469080D|nr:hypothetical protein [Halomonas sp. 25-S5]